MIALLFGALLGRRRLRASFVLSIACAACAPAKSTTTKGQQAPVAPPDPRREIAGRIIAEARTSSGAYQKLEALADDFLNLGKVGEAGVAPQFDKPDCIPRQRCHGDA